MLSKEKEKELALFAKEIQIKTMETIGSLGVGHAGGALSIAELVAVLYGEAMQYRSENPNWAERDWLVVSKGHAGPAVYSALALKEFFPLEELSTLNRPKTHLPSHCDRNLTPGIDMTTGSLGQGASTAAGVALGFQLDQKKNHVYLILGDGEAQEGQVWEMAMFAAQHKLSNLTAFLDYNRLQLDGPIDEICSLGDPAEKFRAFGWNVLSVDGHDVRAIAQAIDEAKFCTENPSMIILNTIKAHGWKEMENQTGSHCPTVSQEQLQKTVSDLQAEYREMKEEICL